MQIEKVIREGKVAILYSPGYGAGWSTWNTGSSKEERDFAEFLIFDPTLVQMAEMGVDIEDVHEYILSKYPEDDFYVYTGGWRDIAIAWVSEGTLFLIHEYDGNESVQEYNPGHYFVA